ncbi:MAG: L-serine ammonia-lyase [Pirellulales bacterium]
MSLSVFDLFSIGIGPSSSHSVGPMRAAGLFLEQLVARDLLSQTNKLQAELYGSLALTGKGHGTDTAIMLGLLGLKPEQVDPDKVETMIAEVQQTRQLKLMGSAAVAFEPDKSIVFNRRKSLPFHPNGMKLFTWKDDQVLFEETYYSVGGGFVLTEHQAISGYRTPDRPAVPFPFSKAKDLIRLCQEQNCHISQIVMRNELTWRSEIEIRAKLLEIWEAMQACVERGCSRDGVLPGGLHVQRRAAAMRRSLISKPESSLRDPLTVLDWVDLYALAVNEENAAGGRVVTAPTNGAAGIVPAVMHYYWRFVPSANEDGIVRFLLTAGAIGMLYKLNASISGAEVGCQGEVGVACSMAAGALTEVLGGSIFQVEQAAEIGMEHNLGLTCDPIRGLVQVPCIERNAMGAVKAINASRLALRGDGQHRVSLDKVIETMRRTGADMSNKYKETSRGGLAVNLTEC